MLRARASLQDKLRESRRNRRARARARETSQRAGPENLDPFFLLSPRVRNLLTGVRLTNPFVQNVWVWKAISVIAENLTRMPLELFTGVPGETETPAPDGPWHELFENPHPDLDASDLWLLTTVYALLPPGDAFWILRSRTGGDLMPSEVPRWAEPVSGRFLKSNVGANGIVRSWDFSRAGSGVVEELLPHELVQFRLPNPWNPRRGQAPIEAATSEVESDLLAGEHNRTMLKDGGQPDGVLEVKDENTSFSKEEADLLAEDWRERFGGAQGQRGRPAILPGGLSFKPTTVSHKDMQFSDQRVWSREAVAAAYGVPLFLMGVVSDVHRETSREAIRFFWRETVIPLATRFARSLDSRLFRNRGAGKTLARAGARGAVWAKWNTEDVEALREEALERRRTAEVDRRLGIPLNEVIRKHSLGYDEQEGGDVALIPVGWERLDLLTVDDPFATGPTEPKPPEEPDPEDDDEPKDPGDPEADPDGEGASEGEDERAFPRLISAPSPLSLPVRASDKARREQHELYLRGVHGPGERRLKRKVSGFFYGRRAETLEELRRLDEQRAGVSLGQLARELELLRSGPYPELRELLEGRAPWTEEVDDLAARALREISDGAVEQWLAEQRKRWDQILLDQTNPIVGEIVEASLERLGEQLGGSLNVASAAHPAMLEFMEAQGGRRIVVNETLQKGIRRALLAGLGQNENLAELQTRIRSVFAMSQRRSLTIARTETGMAAVGAKAEAYGLEGVENHSWLTAGDEFVSSGKPGESRNHYVLDGISIPVGGKFANGLRYPLDSAPGKASEVCNCRCDSLPE